ncbi:ribosome maturation factor RimM [Rubrivivax sp. A210]|uniref:ribosome maturation factor RimM n=1 Tax=Rubrivivax sp. A210 TaxID=2772301 RepID=UPI0039882DFF
MPARPVAGDDTPALPPDAVEVARVLGAWGVKGGIRLKPFAADPQALFSTKRWFLQPPEDASPRPPGAKAALPLPPLLRVMQAKEHGDGIVATVHDIVERDAAEALKGARVFVSRASFPTPDEGEFYWVDLIGLDVVNRGAQALGRVVGLLETGPHCVLRLQAEGAEAETLIPFVDAYVDRVDLGARRIHVDWEAEY